MKIIPFISVAPAPVCPGPAVTLDLCNRAGRIALAHGVQVRRSARRSALNTSRPDYIRDAQGRP